MVAGPMGLKLPSWSYFESRFVFNLKDVEFSFLIKMPTHTIANVYQKSEFYESWVVIPVFL